MIEKSMNLPFIETMNISAFSFGMSRYALLETNPIAGSPIMRFWKFFSLYKLRRYTRISSPKKSHNKASENIRYFSSVFNIANQLLTSHSPFPPFGEVKEWTAKPSPFSIQARLKELTRIMAARTLKNPYRLQTVTFKLFYKRKKTNI